MNISYEDEENIENLSLREGLVIQQDGLLKGQLREIFVLWFYSSVNPIWAPVYFTKLYYIFSEFAKLFELEGRTALWAPAGNQISLLIPGI